MTAEILYDVPHADYHKKVLGEVSSTALTHLARSPLHYRHWLDAGDKPTPAMAFGSMAHTYLLEPHLFEAEYVIEEDFGDRRYKLAKDAYAKWEEEVAKDRKRISLEDNAKLVRMRKSVLRHVHASKLITGGLREVTLRWIDEATGIGCKARPDIWHPDRKICADIKTAEDASPEAFMRAVVNFRYHVQQANYMRGFAACGERVEHYVLIVIEREQPHDVAVYSLDNAAIAAGDGLVHAGIARMANCIARDSWPGVCPGIADLSLPAWAIGHQ